MDRAAGLDFDRTLLTYEDIILEISVIFLFEFLKNTESFSVFFTFQYEIDPSFQLIISSLHVDWGVRSLIY